MNTSNIDSKERKNLLMMLYGDLFDFDDKIVLPLVDQVKDFVAEIKKLIYQ
jgi:hypothetical protein